MDRALLYSVTVRQEQTPGVFEQLGDCTGAGGEWLGDHIRRALTGLDQVAAAAFAQQAATGYQGRVGAFIPGQNDRLAAVVELDSELILEHGAGAVRGQTVRGRFLVLELGHTGTDWAMPELLIHVELCEDAPPPTRWQDRVRGAWVESHATYRIVNEHPDRQIGAPP